MVRIILLVFLILIALLLLTPVAVRLGYERGELSLEVRFGPVRRKIFPVERKPEKKSEKKPEEPAKPKKKRGRAKKEPEEPQKKKPPKVNVNREQIAYTLEKLPPILGRALRGTRRRVRVRPLKVHLLVAGYDPADTAELYGNLAGALAAGLPVLRKAVRIQDEDVRLFLDFSQERMDCIAAVGLAIRPWDLLVIGARAGVSLLKWFLGFRKLASPPPKDQAEQDSGEAA